MSPRLTLPKNERPEKVWRFCVSETNTRKPIEARFMLEVTVCFGKSVKEAEMTILREYWLLPMLARCAGQKSKESRGMDN